MHHAHAIRALWHEHMSGSPVRMDREALRGIDLFAFRQSCGASIYEIARVMHIIECRARYAVGWMRQYLYEDWDDEWRAG